MRTGWLILMGLASGAAHAVSYDCAKAKTPQEKAICANPNLSAADDELGAAYRDLLAAAPAEMKIEIRADQRAWLVGDLRRCKPDTPPQTGVMETCLLADREERAKELRKRFVKQGGVTFVWQSVNLGGERDGDGYLNASWPAAISTAPEWQAWNKAMEAATLRVASTGGTPPPTDWRGVPFDDMDIDVVGSLGPMSPDLVTASLVSDWYGHGAAHPNQNTLQFNWLLKEGRELRGEDVLRAKSGWQAALYKRCDADLHRQLDQDGKSYQDWIRPDEVAKTLRAIVANPENWQLDQSGLKIVFGKYTVAPYCCTPEPVAISWDELKPLLRPDFAIPK
jgi:uncharacterized protein YecT (DUF1311 family)